MRTRVALALGLACALAPVRGRAQVEWTEVDWTESDRSREAPARTSADTVERAAPARASTSTDFAAYPPLRPQPRPRPIAEVHALAVLWWTPLSDEGAPQHGGEPLRLRAGVLRLDAHPTPALHLIARLAVTLPIPLLDAAISWTELPFLNVTLGQFRLPLGAAATTTAGQLVMLDRPGFVYSMTKATFRDVGLMLGTGEEGLADGLLHYRAAVVAGNGRLFDGAVPVLPTNQLDARELLWVARAIVDVGPKIAPGTRVALGGQVAWTRDPALDVSDLDAARGRAASLLGRTWAPIDRERETWLAGTDLTLSVAGLWAQLEWLFLESRPTDGGTSRRSTGASLELAYTLPWRLEGTSFQLAGRGELVDPDLDRAHDDQLIATAGVNVQPASGVRVSAFGTVAFHHDLTTGADRQSGELSLRLALSF